MQHELANLSDAEWFLFFELFEHLTIHCTLHQRDRESRRPSAEENKKSSRVSPSIVNSVVKLFATHTRFGIRLFSSSFASSQTSELWKLVGWHFNFRVLLQIARLSSAPFELLIRSCLQAGLFTMAKPSAEY